MTISEKVAYIKGMFEGMSLDTEKSKEAKLIAAIIDVLEEVGLSIEDVEENVEVLSEEIEEISDDLEEVEELVFGDDGEDWDDECGCGCEDGDFFEIACPNCEEDLVIDSDVLEAGFIQCPNCKERLTIDLSDDDDECGCGCHGHDHGHGHHHGHGHDDEDEEGGEE